jgi:predicted DNA-binding protein
MARLTVHLDDSTLQTLHARARHQGTTASALVREYIEAYTAADPTRSMAGQVLLSLAAGARQQQWVEEAEPPRLRLVR